MASTAHETNAVVYSILRMSQKALMFVLAIVGVGYIGGLIAILFEPKYAQPLAEFTQIFIPLFQLEIGVYGLGSTLENVQKIKNQIATLQDKSQNNTSQSQENYENDEEIG